MPWAVSIRPGPGATDPRGHDARDVARRGIGKGRKDGSRPDICLSQSLEQLRRSALGDPGHPMDHAGVPHPDLVRRLGFQGQDDAWIATHVAKFALPAVQMGGHEFITVQTHPDDRDLGRPVLVDGDEVGERA